VVDAGDVAVLDPHRHYAVDLPIDSDEQRRATIDLYHLDRPFGVALPPTAGQQASHLAGPHDGLKQYVFDSAAVAEGDDVRRQDVEQALQFPGFDPVVTDGAAIPAPQTAQTAQAGSRAPTTLPKPVRGGSCLQPGSATTRFKDVVLPKLVWGGRKNRPAWLRT
jgi:hypothetical protein